MQIGNKYDTAYPVLLSGGEGSDIIMSKALITDLAAGKINTPAVNVQAAMAYLYTRMAKYEYRSVRNAGAVVPSVIKVKPGDTFSKIAKQNGTTVDELKKKQSRRSAKTFEAGPGIEVLQSFRKTDHHWLARLGLENCQGAVQRTRSRGRKLRSETHLRPNKSLPEARPMRPEPQSKTGRACLKSFAGLLCGAALVMSPACAENVVDTEWPSRPDITQALVDEGILIGRLVAHLSHTCNLTIDDELFHVIDVRELIPGAMVPRGYSRIVLFDQGMTAVNAIEYVSQRPLFCEENRLYLLGDLTIDMVNGEGNVLTFGDKGEWIEIDSIEANDWPAPAIGGEAKPEQ